MKYLVVIPARGGSKGIPKKNIKHLNGKPLIHYTIEAAKRVFKDTDICVTTDSVEIKEVVEQTGVKVPFLRPKELATDTAGTNEVLLHAIAYFENKGGRYDALVLLQPTSPFRTAQHIKEAIQLFTKEIDMVVSVKETTSNPYYNLFEENAEGFLVKSKKGNYKRRQDCPKVWEYNGAIYIINIGVLKTKSLHTLEKIVKYPMDNKSSTDIDSPIDWALASLLALDIE